MNYYLHVTYLEPVMKLLFEYIEKEEDCHRDVYLACLNTLIATKQGLLVKAVTVGLDFLQNIIQERVSFSPVALLRYLI